MIILRFGSTFQSLETYHEFFKNTCNKTFKTKNAFIKYTKCTIKPLHVQANNISCIIIIIIVIRSVIFLYFNVVYTSRKIKWKLDNN